MLYSKEKIEAAENLCNVQLPKLLSLFDVKLEKGGNVYYGTCCIHSSDKSNSMAIYLNDGHLNWSCFTKKCHKTFFSSSIGLVRGLLSRQNGYSNAGDRMVSFPETVAWIFENLGNPTDCTFSPCKLVKTEDSPIDMESLGVLQLSREQVRERLNLPSQYMQSRGFSPEVLNLYDVGQSKKYNAKTCWRAIVPIYDPEGKTCIGVTARSVFQECPTCKCFHDSKWPCPKESLQRMYCKWKNVSFKRRYSLYNYWKLPKKCKSLVIVESPGNVWKLVEAGIENVIAIYGSYKINTFQEKLIKDKGVEHVYLGFDDDEPGKLAFQENGKALWEKYHIHKLEPIDSNDFAEMDIGVIKEKICPQIKY